MYAYKYSSGSLVDVGVGQEKGRTEKGREESERERKEQNMSEKVLIKIFNN